MISKKHKLLELKTNAIVDSLFVGNYKTNKKGRGIEFATYKEYDYFDSVKNIDFLKSNKEGKILVKLYEEERELSVYFIIELNDTFYQTIDNFKKIDLVYEIFYLIGFSSIKSGDKLGAYIFNGNRHTINIAKKGKNNFVNLVNKIDNFGEIKNINIGFINKYFKNIKNNNLQQKKNGLNYFNSLRIKNSLVFYITDNLNIDTKQLNILGLKNDLVLCNVFNSFENSLKGKGISIFENGNNKVALDLDNKLKIKEYIDLRLTKINELKRNVLKNGGKYLLIDETKNLYKEFYKIFK